jgi:FkbM family methyltransferase
MRSEEGSLDWRSYVRPGDTVFDVGANMGNKTLMYLEQGARAVCVEPQPVCLAALKKQFKRNRRVVIIPKGLAEKPGTLDFSICSKAHTISTFAEQWKTGRFAGYKWDKVIPVQVTTLDELIRSHGVPAYCKIDVEGFELSVLKGLSRPIPLLSFEFAREFTAAARTCVDHLRQIGFEMFDFTQGENPQFVSGNWLDAEGLFERIGQIADPDLWGDIYAHHPGTLPQRPPACEPADGTAADESSGGISRALRRLFSRFQPGVERGTRDGDEDNKPHY